MEIKISARAKRISNILYGAYGTDTGILFGISTDRRNSVEAIIQLALKENKIIQEASTPDVEWEGPYDGYGRIDTD